METPQCLRKRIITQYNSGRYTQKQIAKNLALPASTVNGIVHLHRRTGSTLSRAGNRSGRPRLLTVREERALARESVVKPRATARQLQQSVGGGTASVSISTIKRTLTRMGRVAHRPKKGPILTAAQKATRYKWCLEHRGWTVQQWNKVSCMFLPVFDPQFN